MQPSRHSYRGTASVPNNDNNTLSHPSCPQMPKKAAAVVAADTALTPSPAEEVEDFVVAVLRARQDWLELWTERLREWMADRVLRPLVAAVNAAHEPVNAVGGEGWGGGRAGRRGHSAGWAPKRSHAHGDMHELVNAVRGWEWSKWDRIGLGGGGIRYSLHQTKNTSRGALNGTRSCWRS